MAVLKARVRQFAENDVSFEQRDLYAFNPKESHVSTEFAAASPDSWTPKTATAEKVGTEKVPAKEAEPRKP